jgi:penicillin-binding protein 1C
MHQQFMGVVLQRVLRLSQLLSLVMGQYLKNIVVVLSCLLACLIIFTFIDLAISQPKISLNQPKQYHPVFTDRFGELLTVSYQNQLNNVSEVNLTEIPEVLIKALVLSEDQHFYKHHGVDWGARIHAIYELLKEKRIVRGASSLSEQVVRIVYPRERTFWSRWIQGWNAILLERRYSKQQLLEFYLNQVPYGARRRGIKQAASYYFGRDISTLNQRELLALVVILRAPEHLNPKRNSAGLNKRIDQLSRRLLESQQINRAQFELIALQSLEPTEYKSQIEAGHFVQYLRQTTPKSSGQSMIKTTLDGTLQQQIQKALSVSLRRYKENQVAHGAVLVVDHQNGAVLAWVNDRSFSDTKEASQIDAITALRQPGSTLKPFVYATALENGWTAATEIEDLPFARQVGIGLHRYRNYSRNYHGNVRLRTALGSSLNIPAIKAAEFVGRDVLLNKLHQFSFFNLNRSADFYGEGLALGNGEVSLLELVQAYATLARSGSLIKISGIPVPSSLTNQQVISEESASIITHILADPEARVLEFGRGGVLQFPNETAVKTGTSTGYRDLWALGYSSRFTVGVWMGNLDRSVTVGLTSSQGPAVLLRSVFALLERRWEGAKLPLKGELVWRKVCDIDQEKAERCHQIDELFNSKQQVIEQRNFEQVSPQILVPSPGLVLAKDPRIPDQLEHLKLRLDNYHSVKHVAWFIDGTPIKAQSSDIHTGSWALEAGSHSVKALVELSKSEKEVVTIELGPVEFFVQGV